jgi:hypothetical protein
MNLKPGGFRDHLGLPFIIPLTSVKNIQYLINVQGSTRNRSKFMIFL